jgi:hypothetical protein
VPKPSTDVQDLKRCLARLARLEGRPLACAEGLVLFEPVRVRDPRPLLRGYEDGPPTIADVAAALELSAPPLILTVGTLGAATRDLRILQEPRTRTALKEAPRIFRRHGELDEARIARWRQALAGLAERLHAAREPVPWTTRALDAIGLAHGDEARALLERAMGGLRGGAGDRERGRRFLAEHALAFDPRPRSGGELTVGADQIERSGDALDEHLARYGDFALRLDEVLELGRIDLGGASSSAAKLVADGLPVDKVRRLAELGRAADLDQLGEDPEVAAAYVDWAAALVPHYTALGLDVPLTPAVFEHLRKATRREDLGVLAVCLMKHHTKASADSAAEALARLDATLGLFQRRPAEAASILAELSGTSPGAGRDVLPEVAGWLGDDALLDRYVHLARLAGVSPALSRTLRADFDRAARLEGERVHLAALAAPSAEQAERLRRLSTGEVAPPDPARTRRRLAERIDDLTARAYERRLDAVFRGILKQVFRISLARLTPAWRDAIRFYLAAKRNRELTSTVLRAAAAGVDLARTLPRNRAWIDEVSGRMDVAAWLAPRAREVTLGGKVHTLAVEQDPIEVLRMGIPFGTCLSLDDGVNAASTVVNAADANKRVLYLRDPGGSIVARKLVAVSEEGAIVGYNLYVAPREHVTAVGAAFQAFCEELAAATGLPLAREGTPRQIHPGFWYDDGAVPFDEVPEAADAPVKAYCRSLGLSRPVAADDRLLDRARLFGALERQDRPAVAVALRAFGDLRGVAGRAAAFLLDRLDGRELVAEARRSTALAIAAVARAAADGPEAMLDLAGRIADPPSAGEAVERLLRFPRTPEIAFALVAAALRTLSRARENDGYGLDHRTVEHLASFAGALPVAGALALCTRADPLFRALARNDCADCAASAERHLLEAIELSYAGARDPDAVIHCLANARARLPIRAALRIAARYALAGEALPALPPPRLQPLHPCPSAVRALVRLRARDADLDAEPDFLAALLRQSGGVPRDPPLPTPKAAPFEALGDLLAQLDLASIVAPFCGADVALPDWKPGPWELYHHRRHRTPRRAALLAKATHSPPAPAACEWMARLGDLGALGAAERSLPARTRDRVTSCLRLARHAADQVEASHAADPLAAVAALPPETLDDVIDQGLLVAALARVEDHLAAGSGEVELALSIVLRSELSAGAALALAARLVARESPSPAELAFAENVLARRSKSRPGDLVRAPDLAAVFGPVASLHEALAKALQDLDDFAATFPAVEAALARVGHAEATDGLLSAWVSALVAGSDLHALGYVSDEALFRRVTRIVCDKHGAVGAVVLYQEMWAPEHAAVILDELRRSPLPPSELRDALRTTETWMRDAHNAAAAGWLKECVAEAG